MSDLQVLKTLGSGFFSEVSKVKEVGGEQRVFALKSIKLSLVEENNLSQQVQREIDILYSLQHPRIIRLYFDFRDDTMMYLGMEFTQGGTLFERLSAAGKFPPELAAHYFRQTCEALDYLHHLADKVIHRDIKPENILLDSANNVKLADFGWANLMDINSRETFCGTLEYLAPEMISGAGHNESVDMWSMGVLLYELSTGQSPFFSNTKEATCSMILRTDIKYPGDIDSDARDLVSKLCKKRAEQRLSVRDALAHPFIQKRGPSTGKTPKGIVEVEPAEDEGLLSRPSVAERKLKQKREKVNLEVQQLVLAKQQTEEQLMMWTAELEDVNKQIRDEQLRRERIDASNVALEKACNDREKQLEKLRREVKTLEAKNAPSRLSWLFGKEKADPDT